MSALSDDEKRHCYSVGYLDALKTVTNLCNVFDLTGQVACEQAAPEAHAMAAAAYPDLPDSQPKAGHAGD